MKSLLKNSTYNVLYVLMNIVFPLITIMYVSRIILVEGTGKVAYAQTIASYFLTVASVGIPVYGIKAIASCGDDKDSLNKNFCELFYINLISSAVFSIMYFTMIYMIDAFKEDFYLYCACGVQVVLNAINIEWLFKGKEEYGYILVRSFIVKVLAFIAVIFFVKELDDYIVYALITSIALAGNHVLNVIYARKYVGLKTRGLNFKRHIKPLIVLSLIGFLGTLYNKIDITMLGMMTDDNIVGLYSNAHKSINIVLSVTTAMTAVFLPRLSSLYHNKEKQELQKVLRTGADIISFICIPACIGILVLAPYLIDALYGEAFHNATSALRLFVPLILINSYGDLFCYQLIVATGNEKKRLVISTIGVLINIVLNLLLIPILMEKGATIASVCSEFVINISLYIYIKRKMHFSLSWTCIFKSLVAAIGMGLVVYYITTFEFNCFMMCFSGIIIGVFVYVLLNLLMKNEILIECFKKVMKR